MYYLCVLIVDLAVGVKNGGMFYENILFTVLQPSCHLLTAKRKTTYRPASLICCRFFYFQNFITIFTYLRFRYGFLAFSFLDNAKKKTEIQLRSLGIRFTTYSKHQQFPKGDFRGESRCIHFLLKEGNRVTIGI